MNNTLQHFYNDEFVGKCINALTLTPFWSEDSDGCINLDKASVIRYLEVGLPSMGFSLFNHDGNFIPIQMNDNVIREVDHKDIKSFVQLIMSNLPNGKEIINQMTIAYTSYFDAKVLTALPILHGYQLLKDSRSRAYRLHSNGAVEIGSDGTAQLVSYKDLPDGRLVWASNILSRPIDMGLVGQYDREVFISDNTDKEGNHFYKWMQNLSKRLKGNKWVYDSKNFETIASGFGYMLHRYWADQKVVCFIDENPTDDEANGRTGKSMVMNYAMCAALDSVIVDGKILSSKNSQSSSANFKFNSVTPATQYIGIDDVHKTFDFSNLFSLTTGNISVNKKFGQMFDLKGHDKPKLGLSTNHPIKGDGVSYDDRQHHCFVGPYYQKHKFELGQSPDQLHGGHLFDEEWGTKNWSEFDATCVNALRFYLASGLVGGGTNAQYKLNKLNASVGSAELVSTLHRFLEKNDGMVTYQKYLDGMSDEESDRCLQEFVIDHTGEKLSLPRLSAVLNAVAKHFGYGINKGYEDNRKQVRFGDGIGKAVNAYIITSSKTPFASAVEEDSPTSTDVPSTITVAGKVSCNLTDEDAEELFANLNTVEL